MYSDSIKDALERFHDYLGRNLQFCRDHPAARVSAFWSEHFTDRRNFPDVSDFMAFRRGEYLYGIGDSKYFSQEQKQREFEDICRSVGLFTPPAFIARLRDPVLGAPVLFRHGDQWHSGSFVLNAGTTWRICELMASYGSAKRALDVCEIGAGWGACALQLHQAADIANYTVIDLPENLCLSSTFLAAVMPGRNVSFVECADSGTSKTVATGFSFGLPPAIDRLEGPYDLVLNTVSLQEMDLETVQTYLRWTAKVLAPDGLLVSFNAHDKAGVRRPSDYLVEGLAPVHMQPFRKLPAGFFNTVPYEMAFRPTTSEVTNGVAEVDAVGEMIQLGLEVSLNESDASLLAVVRDFFYAPDESTREVIAAALLGGPADCRNLFIVANWRFAQGEFATASDHLQQSLAQGLDGFARVRALVMLSLVDAPRLAEIEPLAGGLWGEIKRIVGERDIAAVQHHIAGILDCPANTPLTVGAVVRGIRRRLAAIR